MYCKKSFLLFVFACLALAHVPTSRAQEGQGEDEEVRQIFFATRPGGAGKKSSTGSSAGANRSNAGRKTTTGKSARDNKSGNASASKGGGTKKTAGGTAKTKASDASAADNSGAASSASPAGELPPADAIALGYTLYMRDEGGNGVRVAPSKEFAAGDRIRVALEANTDGYLYIFHSEDGRNPQLLFPDVRLNRGVNTVRAHVPYQVPASLGDWFKFDSNPATERLYIVLTRQPLAGVPVGDELLKFARIQFANQPTTEQIDAYCRANAERCIWHPMPALWQQVTSAAKAPVLTSAGEGIGQAETTVERDATVRGIGLSQDDPAPSVIRMSSSSNARMMVTVIDLIHK